MVYGVVPTKNRFLGGSNISKIWHGVGPTKPGVSSEKKFIPQIPEELAETNQGLTDKKWWFDEHTLIFELPRIAPFNRQTLGDLINQATYTSNQPKSAIFFSSSPGILGWFFIGKIEMGLKLGVSHSISWFTWKMAIPLYYFSMWRSPSKPVASPKHCKDSRSIKPMRIRRRGDFVALDGHMVHTLW